MTIGRRQPGSSISIAIQYCNADGNAKDLAIVHEFLEWFSVLESGELSASSSSNGVTLSPWLEATLAGGDTGGVMRAKYKSTYMKKPFTEAEGHTLYKFLTSREIDAQGFVLSVDGYGAATNASERTHDAAIAQLRAQCAVGRSKSVSTTRPTAASGTYTRMISTPISRNGATASSVA
jgi:hypothetical protein